MNTKEEIDQTSSKASGPLQSQEDFDEIGTKLGTVSFAVGQVCWLLPAAEVV